MEMERIVTKLEEDNIVAECITVHPGFAAVCLNVWVLQAAYFQYRQQYGINNLPPTVHE